MSTPQRDLLRRITAAGRWPDPALVDELAALGDAALEELAGRGRQDLRRRPEEAALPVVLGLLGDIGDASVAADLVALYRRYDDDTLDHVGHAVVRLGGSALVPLLEVVRDRSVRWYGRAMAAAAAVRIARPDPADRAGVGGALHAALEDLSTSRDPSDNDRNLAASLAWGLARLPHDAGRDAISKAFRNRVIVEPSVTPTSIDAAYANPARPRVTPPFTSHYRLQWDERRRDQAWLESERERKAGGAPPASERPGRNDPCWCGSGKKYKRCHADADAGR
jgi:hypothetical protein